MGSRQYNIRPVRARSSNVYTVKIAPRSRGNYTGQREPCSDCGDPAGDEPLDTIVFTAGFTFLDRPGFAYVNPYLPRSPARAELIRYAVRANKSVTGLVRCRAPPSLRFDSPPSKIEMEENQAKTINLRAYYPFYASEFFIDVPDEVAAMLYDFELREAAYRLRTYRHRAHFSLDRGDGIEKDITFVSLSPCGANTTSVTGRAASI